MGLDMCICIYKERERERESKSKSESERGSACGTSQELRANEEDAPF